MASPADDPPVTSTVNEWAREDLSHGQRIQRVDRLDGGAQSPAGGFPGASRPSPAATAITQTFEIYGASSQADLAFLKCLGFNQVILDFLNLAGPAERCGLSVVLANFWDRQPPGATSFRCSELAQGLTDLASINMMDEPIDNGLADHRPRRLPRTSQADPRLRYGSPCR